MKVLVLGHSGMLGDAVFGYLMGEVDSLELLQEEYRWPSESFKSEVKKFDGDYIINCIGAIPQRTDNFEINYELPIWLDENVSCSVIHQDTDSWEEKDEYSLSKIKASNYKLPYKDKNGRMKTSD